MREGLRTARRVVAIVGVSLLVASDASAACAWVLWGQTIDTGRIKQPFTPYDTYDAPAGCQAGLTKQIESWKRAHAALLNIASDEGRQKLEQSITAGTSSATIRNSMRGQAGWESIDLICLPDTIDPRGPKGGGR